MILALLLACAPKLPLVAPTRQEHVDQFALTRGEHTFAGMAVVVLEGPKVTLQALTPAGSALFTIEATAEEIQVRAPDPQMAALLERLPFHRDLMLVYAWSCPPGRCAADGGTIREQPEDNGLLRRWRGPGGPATLHLQPGKAVLTDPLRRYTLTVVGEEIGPP